MGWVVMGLGGVRSGGIGGVRSVQICQFQFLFRVRVGLEVRAGVEVVRR